MKHILVFGAGKSATVLIEYLKELATENVWKVTIADANLQVASSKVGDHALVTAVKVALENEEQRIALIREADVVISLMPPALHYLIARDCVALSKHLLTASYVDENIKLLEKEIKDKGLLFLCEMGLDPGIDHMSAMKLVDEIHAKGGKITSFVSHCGGLIAPESDTNPWHYKISWNPKNIVMAGKAGAVYKEGDAIKHLPYEQLFSVDRMLEIPEAGTWAYYPNRDSLPYAVLYGLESASTFIRTTLRHPEFCFGWKNIVDLKLTDETVFYDTNGMSIATFFKEHFDKHGFAKWLNEMLMSRLSFAKDMMEKLKELVEAEEQAVGKSTKEDEALMMVNDKGELNTFHIDDVKDKAAETVAYKMHEANIIMKQLLFLGLNDETVIDKGRLNAAEILQFIIEKKWVLQPTDKDMVLMLHEIEYELFGKLYVIKSSLMVKGKDNIHTAMAATVGLPLGIATKLLLENKIQKRGLHIPISPEFYKPVLAELANFGIEFKEVH